MAIFASYFDPVAGISGGMIIGLSAAVLLLFNGDVFGCSGIVSSCYLQPRKTFADRSQSWKVVLLASFFATSKLLKSSALDEALENDPTFSQPSWVAYLLGGVLIGFGTKMGNGCTTGHGICGMARLSPRSIVAVGTFMFAALLSASITSPNTRFASAFDWLRGGAQKGFGMEQVDILGTITTTVVALMAAYVLVQLLIHKDGENLQETSAQKINDVSAGTLPESQEINTKPVSFVDEEAQPAPCDGCPCSKASSNDEQSPEVVTSIARAKILPAAAAGALFSGGLALSQMVLPSKNFGFLDVTRIPDGIYDPTLMFVMAGGVVISFLSYQFVSGWEFFNNPKAIDNPLANKKHGKFSIPTNKTIDWKLICGGACFGLGWGVCGICPGPGVYLAATGVKSVLFIYWPGFITGSVLAHVVKENCA